jgi:electron transfer flavoprotein alpha/beta subunit
MLGVCLFRRTFDPRELSSLRIAGNQIVADRTQLVKNEGDVRAIQLVKGGGAAFHAVSVGVLDATTRVHLFVYGAQEVWELGASPSHALEETQVARMIGAQVRRLEGVQLVAMGCVEQDTGRDMLPGLVAAELGWELFSHVVSLRVDDQRARLTQVTDGGTHEIDVALPICVSADDSCAIGSDPSDEYDLIEKLEKRASRVVPVADLGVATEEIGPPELSAPPEREPQPVGALGAESVAKVAEMLRSFQA